MDKKLLDFENPREDKLANGRNSIQATALGMSALVVGEVIDKPLLSLAGLVGLAMGAGAIGRSYFAAEQEETNRRDLQKLFEDLEQ